MDWSSISTAATSATAYAVTFLHTWWPWLLIGAADIAAFYGAWWLWWRLPKRRAERLRMTIRDAKARVDVEDNFRKTMGRLLLGAAVLLGAGLAYLQFSAQQENARQQLAASLEQAKQQRESARALLISNQVSKGFEQLGSDKVEQRLSGIYALEGVMNISNDYRQPVLEALCAFVRGHTKESTSKDAPTTDVQAVLTVIGRRHAIGELILNLSNVHIQNANLSLADLSSANLSRARLSGADLRNADLSSADLSGADLKNADLRGARLSGTELVGAVLSRTELSGTDLSDADLRSADLSSANLSSAVLLGAVLSRAELSGAELSGADLRNSDLSGADLSGTRNLTQLQLDLACGTDVKLDPGLTIKPCP